MKEYFSLQQKSISLKMDVAKLMSEVLKHNGDVSKALENDNMKGSKLDLAALRKLAKDANTNANNTTEEYNIK